MFFAHSAVQSPAVKYLRCLTFGLGAAFMAVQAAPQAQAQGAGQPFFYSGGKKHPLPLSTKWAGVQIDSSANAGTVEAELQADGGIAKTSKAIFHRNKNVVVVPFKQGVDEQGRSRVRTRIRAAKGVKRAIRIFGNGSSPVVETDEILVRFKPGVTKAAQNALFKKYDVSVVRGLLKTSNGFVLRLNSGQAKPATEIANAIYESGQVLFSNPNLIWPKQTRFVPNDTLYSNEWHLNNTGQLSGTAGADIKAEAAWNITRGNSNIKIAIIDDGFDLTHEDLQGQFLPGYDVIDDDNDPSASTGDNHGTEVAGIAAGIGNNGMGITGVAPNVKIIPIRLVNPSATWEDEHDAFVWAADHGADVINCSWGPPDRQNIEQPLPDVTKQGIDYAADTGRGGKGCAIFFAAGNGYESADLDGYSSYSKVISVAATTNTDLKAEYSDHGTSVDLAAPGGGAPGFAAITTTDRTGNLGEVAISPDNSGNYYTNFAGTSASAPIASGVAALALSLNPSLTRLQLQALLQNNADKVGGVTYDEFGHNDDLGYGRINALRVVQNAATLYTVSGSIALANNTAVSGVGVTADSTNGYAETAANGAYTLSIPAGTATITPSKTGYYFTPASRSVTVGPNATAVNFVALPFTVTLVTPASNATISGTTPLVARTSLDSVVQRIDFQRRTPLKTFSRTVNAAIPDATPGSPATPGVISDSTTFTGAGTATSATVSVNITHGWISDLIVSLITPSGARIKLHNREGGGGQSIVKTYTVPLTSENVAGNWKLEISDNDPTYTGTFNSWSLAVSPNWTTVASDTNGPSSGDWTASWDSSTAPVGIYEMRALATTTTGPFEGINTNITIAAAPVVLNITGQITNGANVGVSGVTVSRTGSATTATTDASGNYTLANVPAGTYTVTPTLAGSDFLPVNRSVTVTNATVTGVNFVTAPTIAITAPAANASYQTLATATGTAGGAGLKEVRGGLFRYAQAAVGGNPAVTAGWWAGGTTWTAGFTVGVNDILATGKASWTFTLPTLPANKYRFTGIAVDNAGNRVQKSNDFFIATDVTPPTVTVTTPANNAVLK